MLVLSWIEVTAIVVATCIAATTLGLQLICFRDIRRLRAHAKDVVNQSAEIAAKTVAKEVSVVAAAAAVTAADALIKHSQGLRDRGSV